MSWFAFAALMSLPAPTNVRLPDIRAIFTADDFPRYLQEAGVSRIVYSRITVRPDGSIQSCAAEASSGDPTLDAYTCALIVKRAKFRAATWTDGTPVYGVIRAPVSWMVSDGIPSDEYMLRVQIPDAELSVNQLPKGAHSILGVSLEIAADENGRPVSCTEWPHLKGDHRKQFSELVPVACQQVMTQLHVSPPVDPSGKKARSVQSVSVHFIVGR